MKNSTKKKIVLTVCILPVSFLYCWYYSFTGQGLPGVETISIPLFTDRTKEVQVREKLQNLMIGYFQDENILRVVGINQADAVLNGVIESIEDVPTALTKAEEAQQWELRVNVRIKFEEKKTGKVLVSESFTGVGFYKDPVSEREQAINDALVQLIRDISNKIVSGW
ncbi:hypothetical protein IID62_01140 [candidate division KSB1 bacterium]|nr:hypothetical protein [candidate division KSB1 bacterium]